MNTTSSSSTSTKLSPSTWWKGGNNSGNSSHHAVKPTTTTNNNSPDDSAATPPDTLKQQQDDFLIREMELGLGYFEEALLKGTLEILPRIVNVLLENAHAIIKKYSKRLKSTNNDAHHRSIVLLLKELSELTHWADCICFRAKSRCLTSIEDVSKLIRSIKLHIVIKEQSSEDGGTLEPPPLPPKTRACIAPPTSSSSNQPLILDWFSNPLFGSVNEERRLSNSEIMHDVLEEDSPPPLPPKRRNIMSYMEIFGKSSLFTDGEIMTHNFSSEDILLHKAWQQQEINYHIVEEYETDNDNNEEEDEPPPILPPKKKINTQPLRPYKKSSSLCPIAATSSVLVDEPTSTYQQQFELSLSFNESLKSVGGGGQQHQQQQQSGNNSIAAPVTYSSCASSLTNFHSSNSDISSLHSVHHKSSSTSYKLASAIVKNVEDLESSETSSRRSSLPSGEKPISSHYNNDETEEGNEEEEVCSSPSSHLLEEILDVTHSPDLLYYNADGSDSGAASSTNNSHNEVRAGSPDALLILATQSLKNDFLFQEAFLSTYRTFLTSSQLLEKLMRRFRKMNNSSVPPYGSNLSNSSNTSTCKSRQRAAKSAFSLLVRVVDCLADCDFQDISVMELLTEFMSELVAQGELMLSRALRSKFLQKYENNRAKSASLTHETPCSSVNNNTQTSSNNHHSVTTPTSNILQYKSNELAEQMTYLDSQLFIRLEPVELILWVQEQNEDKSPHLTKFTEHFNNMSFWARTQILVVQDGREREKIMSKFIKIMKILRKMNNFNSYLALLSALDSAPIRRLEWSKSITEALKDYCALIDSSSSFRSYRQALNEAGSPCIPYVGLILQDLTFVHIGNTDTYQGKINFAKRWQQFNILENLRRFRKSNYSFKRREDLISFFNDFSTYLSEDELWRLSELIKPRGSATTN